MFECAMYQTICKWHLKIFWSFPCYSTIIRLKKYNVIWLWKRWYDYYRMYMHCLMWGALFNVWIPGANGPMEKNMAVAGINTGVCVCIDGIAWPFHHEMLVKCHLIVFPEMIHRLDIFIVEVCCQAVPSVYCMFLRMPIDSDSKWKKITRLLLCWFDVTYFLPRMPFYATHAMDTFDHVLYIDLFSPRAALHTGGPQTCFMV